MANDQSTAQPPQQQDERPGIESEMRPKPISQDATHSGWGKLQDRIAIITGGDSGIGRAVAIAFAKEGCTGITVVYLNEHADANETKKLVEEKGAQCLLIAGDVGDEQFCQNTVKQTVEKFGSLDIVVNNASEQHPQEKIENITAEQLERTFRTNVFGYFFMTKASMPYLNESSTIINTSSVTAYRGSESLLDYSSTKGAEVAFTRSLAKNLALRKTGIRVNAVAPGPIWTPLIPSTFDEQKVAGFGTDVPLGRVGQPEEVAPCFVFLASDDSSYMTGQVLHPNGGEVVNG